MSDRTNSRNQSTIHVELPRRTIRLLSDKLPENAVVLLVGAEHLQPEWFKLPDGKGKRGRKEACCPITGMGRTWVMNRIKDSQATAHPVKARHIRERGSSRGVVIVDRASYQAYLESFPTPEWAAPVAAPATGMDGDGI